MCQKHAKNPFALMNWTGKMMNQLLLFSFRLISKAQGEASHTEKKKKEEKITKTQRRSLKNPPTGYSRNRRHPKNVSPHQLKPDHLLTHTHTHTSVVCKPPTTTGVKMKKIQTRKVQ
jgi:uncharacterized Zn finger protein